MASRNPYSSLSHRAPAASSLFDSYPGHDNDNSRSRPASSRSTAQHSYGGYSGRDSPYSGDHNSSTHLNGSAGPGNAFRPASPNKK